MRTIKIGYDGDSTVVGTEVHGGILATVVNGFGEFSVTVGGSLNADGHQPLPGTEEVRQSPRNEPAIIQSLCNDAFGVGNVIMHSHGNGGADALSSINGTGVYANANNLLGIVGSLGARVAANDFDMWLCKFGINDVDRVSPATFKSHLNTWISTVQGVPNAVGRHAIAVLVTPNPTCSLPRRSLDPIAKATIEVGIERGVMVVDHYGYISQNFDWKPMVSDSVHPSTQLYDIMGRHTFYAIAPMLHVLRNTP